MMAAGKRPVPFRTRKLSPPAPMVLPPGGSGRVGYRRPNNFTPHTRRTNTDGAAGAFSYAQLLTHETTWVETARSSTNPSATHRIADNHSTTNNGCLPTNHVAGGFAKVNAGDFPPGQTAAENGSFVKLLRNQPGEDPQCGQPQHHPSLVRTHENPGATPPGGARPATGPQRSRGQHTQPP